MRYINGLHEGETIRNVYLCRGKRSAETRNGKPYDNLILQDKTGTLDGKVWDPNSQGIADYDEKDFIEVYGDVISYNGNLQLNIKQIRRAEEGEYEPADYMPTTDKNVDKMYDGLTAYIGKISNSWLKQLLEFYFVKDEEFIRKFKGHSAAKTVHHGFSAEWPLNFLINSSKAIQPRRPCITDSRGGFLNIPSALSICAITSQEHIRS